MFFFFWNTEEPQEPLGVFEEGLSFQKPCCFFLFWCSLLKHRRTPRTARGNPEEPFWCFFGFLGFLGFLGRVSEWVLLWRLSVSSFKNPCVSEEDARRMVRSNLAVLLFFFFWDTEEPQRVCFRTALLWCSETHRVLIKPHKPVCLRNGSFFQSKKTNTKEERFLGFFENRTAERFFLSKQESEHQSGSWGSSRSEHQSDSSANTRAAALKRGVVSRRTPKKTLCASRTRVFQNRSYSPQEWFFLFWNTRVLERRHRESSFSASRCVSEEPRKKKVATLCLSIRACVFN